ncbi:MAG: hypothetical protein QM638_07140 [Nocardioides sp.]|uniref:hypothetical protein n=1 Tax=Nocardioides sp. TaxID=35761 RepID=UPI0039E49335
MTDRFDRFDRFDAGGAGGTGGQESFGALLRRLQHEDADRDLRRALDDVRDLLARWRAEEEHEPLEPGVVAALEAVTGAPGAPLSYRSLARRVAEGTLSWHDFWLDPRREPDGTYVVRDVLAHQTARLQAALDDLDAHGEESARLDRDLDAELRRRHRDTR